jgi:glycosyltransferase involved in cell wall biosynthesis
MARVSVLMSVYNVEPYIFDALASIQSQTLTDIEIVVIDDGSTDGTLRIVEQLAATDPRIKIVRTPRNLGLPLALNFGLPFCQTPFIARMDGDDIAVPNRLEKQLRFLEENHDIDLVGCATMAIDQMGNPIPGLGVSRKPSTQEEVAKTISLAAPCLHIWLARSEVYRELSGYREISFVEDYDFLLRAASAGFRISNLPEPLMLIRTRSGNTSSRLEQRKAHYYVIDLYRERQKHGRDSFSRKRFERVVKCGKVENSAFRLAMRCVQTGLQSHNRALRYLLPAFSAILSPWQARYFFDRIRFKATLRSSMPAC